MTNTRAPNRVVMGLLAAGLALTGCKFAPAISSGSLACAEGVRCPAGMSCHPATGKCCADNDTSANCAGPVGNLPGSSGRPGSGGSAPEIDPATLRDSGRSDDAPDAEPGRDAAAPDADPFANGPLRVLDGAFKLMDWSYGCTDSRATASIERWCGFYRGTELWVLNVGRAAISGQARCDGTDPGCLRLTTTVFRSDVAPVRWRPGFTGDLLIYYTDARQQPGEDFHGSVSGWRPGWTEGRLLSPNALFCDVNELDGSSVACYDETDDTHAEIRGGRLPLDAKTPLPRIGGGPPNATNITTTYSGDYFVYSTAPAAGQPASLYVVPAGQANDPGSRMLIANDAYLLTVGANGAWGFFMRGADFSKPSPTGTLVRVDLPSGKNPIEMARGIEAAWMDDQRDAKNLLVAYEVVDDRGEANHRVFPDATQPTRSIAVGRSDRDGLDVSDDARFIYTQALDPKTQKVLAHVFDISTQTACDLGPVTEVTDANGAFLRPYLDRFSRDGKLVFSQKPVGPPNGFETWISGSADCKPIQLLGIRADLPWEVEGKGLVYLDGWSFGSGGTLSFRAPGAPPERSTPVQIFDATDHNFSVIPGETALVVFTSGAPNREGVYIMKVPP